MALAIAAAGAGSQAQAQQRAQENATRSADDAFGVQVGNDRIGLYSDRDTRGFSPLAAGNARIEGMFFDTRGMVTRVLANTTIRVGLTAQSYPFPAPTGIVDYALRPLPERASFSSVLQGGPNTSYDIELDGQLPIVEGKFGIAGGLMYRNDVLVPSDQLNTRAAGLVARWRPADGTEIMLFYGYAAIQHDRFNPLVFTSGPFLPPDVKPTYFGQRWAVSNAWNRAYGLRAHRQFDEHWRLDTGVFHQNIPNKGQIADLYLNTDQNGVAGQHLVTNELPVQGPGVSGEVRLSGVYVGDRARQTLHLMARARSSERNFGGTANAIIAPLVIGQRVDLPQPVWNYGRSSQDEVRQWTVGAQYQFAWRGLGEATLGVQQIDYEKTVTPPTGAPTVTVDKPLFYNGSVAFTLTKRLAAYASFTQGLEEVPLAPENASNAQEAPPAIHTEQYDFGFRYAITPQLRLVVGYFNVQKPYFNVDPTRVYRSLGQEIHKGYEISLAGKLTDRLNVVAGAVLQKPEVTGEGVAAGLIGPKPVSQAETNVRFNLDYRTAWIEGLSVDAAFAYTGERAATARAFAQLGGKQLDAEAFATLDLGFRYRFKIRGNPSTFRAQALNVFDDFAWRVYPSGAFYLAPGRAYMMSLATDF
ncbi:MAG: TonB-dependent receptor [Phenylobacterium sp.]|uniref:TonB-dependent receptor n=1 Tax=Phenylobacterium sp. TaxID=1871053 RepID=UPI002733489A|nr:TonB-dependent receptor [Phenylobacterium sp.]MDP3172828.1 TonB-dependent receptor [Phenylobacterium sp.]